MPQRMPLATKRPSLSAPAPTMRRTPLQRKGPPPSQLSWLSAGLGLLALLATLLFLAGRGLMREPDAPEEEVAATRLLVLALSLGAVAVLVLVTIVRLHAAAQKRAHQEAGAATLLQACRGEYRGASGARLLWGGTLRG